MDTGADGWLRGDVVVHQDVGTHLRVVKRIFEGVAALEADVMLTSDSHRASAASLLDLMQLAARTGDTVLVEARGPDAAAAHALVAGILAAERWDAGLDEAGVGPYG